MKELLFVDQACPIDDRKNSERQAQNHHQHQPRLVYTGLNQKKSCSRAGNNISPHIRTSHLHDDGIDP
jgi:hypothetical protein